jgi:hypothetical protein
MALAFCPAGLSAAELHCPALDPPPLGDTIIHVSPAEVASLPSIAFSAESQTTILLGDGIYPIQSSLQFSNPYVTLRSASGNRDAVILDGGYGAGVAEIIFIDVDHITVADLTIKRAWYHPIHVTGGGHYSTLYNLRIEDGRQQFVKVNQSGGDYADFGLAACNALELTAAGRQFIHDNPTPGFLCYTGGFDLHQTWGWVVRDTVIENIYCTNGGLAEHAIHFFRSNRDPLVERNLILHNARGIGFGLGQEGFVRTFADDPFEGTEMEGRDDEVMHIGGTIQNNVIYANIGLEYDSGIGIESAWKPLVRHNTIYSDEGSFNSAIDVRFSGSESVVLANNLYSPRITLRNDAPDPEQHVNVLATTDLFVDLASGNLHLVEDAFAAIDQGWASGLVDDFDAESRDADPDVGADEWLDPNLAPVVAIALPVDGASFAQGSVIDFSATADDLEDGDLTGSLQWVSNLSGSLGSGGSVATTLPPGLHHITASVSDSGGMQGDDRISVGVTTAECPADLVIGAQTISGPLVAKAVFSVTLGQGVTIELSGQLEVRAGGSIEMGNGFEVLEGGRLEAVLTPSACD